MFQIFGNLDLLNCRQSLTCNKTRLLVNPVLAQKSCKDENIFFKSEFYASKDWLHPDCVLGSDWLQTDCILIADRWGQTRRSATSQARLSSASPSRSRCIRLIIHHDCHRGDHHYYHHGDHYWQHYCSRRRTSAASRLAVASTRTTGRVRRGENFFSFSSILSYQIIMHDCHLRF